MVNVSEESTRKYINIAQSRILKLSNDILSISYSSHKNKNELLFIVSLLDNTVKAFFNDSLKFFLSFYGHKLPVLSHSISSDNSLLITGSADKNIKIWGMQFGDCHKSIFAHSDSVMNVKFVNNTHYFFSVSKDGYLKYWDADKFELILQLNKHVGEIWCLAISSAGDLVYTGGHDKTIRSWKRMEEMVFIQEERQKEQDKIIQEEIERNERMNASTVQESGTVGINSLEIYDWVDRLIETIEIGKKELAIDQMYESELENAFKLLPKSEQTKRANDPTLPPLIPAPKHHAILQGKPVEEFVYSRIKLIPGNEVESTILMLPFTSIECLLDFIYIFLKKNLDIEMCMKCIKIIFKLHYKTISVSKEFQPLMKSIRDHSQDQLKELKLKIGSNIAGLKFFKRQFWDASEAVKEVKKIKL